MESKTFEEITLSKLKDRTPTQHVKIEGVGEIEVYGQWQAEKLIKRLLESDTITG